MLYVYLFHDTLSCLHFSQYTILLSGTLYGGTSNCFMSTYFMDMHLVYLITVYYFTLRYIMPCFISYSYFTDIRFVYLFTVHFSIFWYIICRNVYLLNVYLFHGHASCLPFSRYTILRSGTLHVGSSNCFMSTYFTGIRLFYLFHSILFYFLVHYI